MMATIQRDLAAREQAARPAASDRPVLVGDELKNA